MENLIELLDELTKNKNIKKPWDSDPYYRIEGIETYREGPDVHLLDNIKTYFEEKNIIIKYDMESLVLACIILAFRTTDPLFNWNYIKVGDISFKNDNFDDEIFIKENFELITKNNKIVINSETKEDWEYAKNILLFKITSEKEDDYFLIKELKRWDDIEKKHK